MLKHYPRACGALATLALALPVHAYTGAGLGDTPQDAPVVPLSHTVEQADARLAEVQAARATVDAQYGSAEQVCYSRFFVNHCLEQAREERRLALSGLRAIEVEANRFKRQVAVDKRDQELAERMKKDEEELNRRQAAPPRPHTEHAPAALVKQRQTLEQRQAEHDVRVKRQQEQEAADAGKRADNVVAFERKKVESEQRQAKVAERKAAREEKARKKAEADAKAAASTPPADGKQPH